MVIRVDGRRARVLYPPMTTRQLQAAQRWRAYRRWLDDLLAGVSVEKAGKR